MRSNSTHVLFVCGKNRLRSPTAEAIFSGIDGVEVSSAGTAADADCSVSADLLDWADVVVVMESRQARQLRKQFQSSLLNKRIVILDIPDRFAYMQPELIATLHAKSSRWMT
jgi:predicted protein tyrosine phosphatase